MILHRAATLLGLSVAFTTAVFAGPGRIDPEMLKTPAYTAEANAIVRHNGTRFNNRPLYCNQVTAIVVTGDRPLARFGTGQFLNSTFMAAMVRGNNARWLHDCSDITSKYRPDHMEWTIKDAAFGATALRKISRAPSLPSSGRSVRRVTFQPSLVRLSSQRLAPTR